MADGPASRLADVSAPVLQEARSVDADSVSGSIERLTSLSAETQGRLLASVAILVALWLVRWIANRVIRRRTPDATVHYRWRKATSYLTVVVGLLLIGRVWFEAFQSLATFVGLIGAGIAIALRDPIVNLAGWLFLLWRRPFIVGDRIQVGQHAGDVVDLRLFQFTLLEIGNWVAADQSTGRVIHVPNGKVFTEPVANYTRGMQYIWNELPVVITFESDWQKAKALLLEVVTRQVGGVADEAAETVRSATQRFLIFYNTLTPTVYTSVVERGVMLTIRYLCEPRKRRGTAQAIWEDVLREFAAHDDVSFAYPTQRFYRPEEEGKVPG